MNDTRAPVSLVSARAKEARAKEAGGRSAAVDGDERRGAGNKRVRLLGSGKGNLAVRPDMEGE